MTAGAAPHWLCAALFCLFSMPLGCAKPRPAALTNRAAEPGEVPPSQPVTPATERELSRALGSIALNQHASSKPAPAKLGMRWSDIPAAVSEACDEAGVEMAIVHTNETDSGYVFALRTVEDRPATLTITRLSDDRVYDATASVGWHGEETERAQRLIRAVDKFMRAFGKKRGFEEAK